MMFTGLIAGIGSVKEIAHQGKDLRVVFATPFSAGSILPGDSVAVNGACLTAEKVIESGKLNGFSAYMSSQTLENTNLRALKTGSPVNLELALALGGRLGGHIVSGHVDGLAEVARLEEHFGSRRIRFSCAPEFDIFIVNKGSVCVDGISLTVTLCGPGYFEVNLIPETWRATAAQHWQVGYAANLEVDLLGKYVAKMLRLPPVESMDGQTRASLDLDFFVRNGFN